MIHPWKVLDLEITDSSYQHNPIPSDEITPTQTPNFKDVEILKVQVITKFDT